MWSEEEMRDIEVEPARQGIGSRSMSAGLKSSLSERNLERVNGRTVQLPHELSRGTIPSVIYTPNEGSHGNFMEASYRRIRANSDWSRRLQKAHTSKRQARRTGKDEEIRSWKELDSGNSSDALLMNIFCYPRVPANSRLQALLNVEFGHTPEFGYHPRIPLQRGLTDRTEIDMRLGSLLVEAKLTEADFQVAPVRLLERYPAFDSVFDPDALEVEGGRINSYQLIRGVLAANAEDATFCLLCDGRRPDLIEAWYAVMGAVRSYAFRSRLRLVLWQEIASAVPQNLRIFLAEKYGIEAIAPRPTMG